MAESHDNFNLKGLGLSVSSFYRSSAVSPIITLYLLFSFFAFVFGQKEIWLVISGIVFVVFLVTLFRDPDRLRSEEYNIEQKRIAIGDKNKLLSEAEEGVIYQPQATIPIAERAGKKQ